MSKRNYLILTSLKKKLTSKWFIGMNIFILIALLLIFNMGNIIALFGGDFQKEKTIILIDNSNNYEYLKEKLEKHSKDLSFIRIVDNIERYRIALIVNMIVTRSPSHAVAVNQGYWVVHRLVARPHSFVHRQRI